MAAFGLLVLFSLALTWIAVGMGMASPNAEAAANSARPLTCCSAPRSATTGGSSSPGAST